MKLILNSPPIVNPDKTLEIIDNYKYDTVKLIITEDIKELASIELTRDDLHQLAHYFTKHNGD